MFEIVYTFYIKQNGTTPSFYEWLKKIRENKDINSEFPEGVKFLGIMKPMFGDVGQLQVRLEISDVKLIEAVYQASHQSGFFNELQSYIDGNRCIQNTVMKKIL